MKKEINTIRLTFVAVIILLLLIAVALSVFLVRAIIAAIDGETGLPSDISRPAELNVAVENRLVR